MTRSAQRSFWVAFFLILSFLTPVRGDYQAAEKAYQRGDYIGAITHLRPLAEAGDDKAQFSLGMMYAKGEGVDADLVEAYVWVSKAIKGARFESDKQRMRSALEKIKGKMKTEEFSRAQAKLSGKTPEKKPVTPQEEFDICMINLQAGNYQAALDELTKLSEKGFMKAALKLGEMYSNGTGVEKDAEEAFKWYKKAADANDPEGKFQIAQMYMEGRGVPQDEVEGAKQMLEAAEMDFAKAQFQMTLWYEAGKGLNQNFEEAYFWSILAAGQGIEEAEQKMLAYQQSLPPETAQSIRERAKEWKPKKP